MNLQNAFGMSKNEVVQYEGFFLSYQPNTGNGLFKGDSMDETALVVEEEGRPNEYFILNGNFLPEMKAAADTGGLLEAYNFFLSEKDEFESSWSTGNDEALVKRLKENLKDVQGI